MSVCLAVNFYMCFLLVKSCKSHENIPRLFFWKTKPFSCIIFLCRLCIERVLHGCFVPVSLNMEDRMKRLFDVYNSLDEVATKYVLKCHLLHS